MFKTIILIPIDHKTELTTISLSLINFIKINKFNSVFFSPFSIKNNKTSYNSTYSFITKKNITETVSPIYIESKKNLYDENFFSKKMETIFEKYKKCEKKNQFFILEGIKESNLLKGMHLNLNLKIAKTIKAEVILVSNTSNLNQLKSIEKKILVIFNIIQKKYKLNVIGIIINNAFHIYKSIFSITKDVNYYLKNHLKKINSTFVPKKYLFNTKISKKICIIPKKNNFTQISLQEICEKLHLKEINLKTTKNIFINHIQLIKIENLKQDFYEKKSNLIVLTINKLKIDDLKILCKKIKNLTFLILSSEFIKNKILQYYKKSFKKSAKFLYSPHTYFELLKKLKNKNLNTRLKYENSKIQYTTHYIKKSNILNFKEFSFNQYSNKNSYSAVEFKFKIQQLCRKTKKTILFPEGEEEKIIQSANICSKLNLCSSILLGNPKIIQKKIVQMNINLHKNVTILDPKNERKKYIPRLIKLRKNKGMDLNIAKNYIKTNMVFPTLLLDANKVDGIVSGISHTTAETLRPPLQLIKTKDKFSIISSIFFMLFDKEVKIYGDCAINILPNENQLAEIAIQSAETAKQFGINPIVAMLSYSTNDSARGKSVDLIKKAVSLIKEKKPNLTVDGPIQYDAAINTDIGKKKSPYSPVAGKANVFIFPDLNSGNITYKAVQHSSNIISVGPILQGLKKPINDLSRGSSIEDIIYTTAITIVQSYFEKK